MNYTPQMIAEQMAAYEGETAQMAPVAARQKTPKVARYPQYDTDQAQVVNLLRANKSAVQSIINSISANKGFIWQSASAIPADNSVGYTVDQITKDRLCAVRYIANLLGFSTDGVEWGAKPKPGSTDMQQRSYTIKVKLKLNGNPPIPSDTIIQELSRIK